MAKPLSSLKWRDTGYMILRLLEGFMFLTQVITRSFVFPLNSKFKSLRFTLNGYYLIIFWAHWMLNVRSIDVCQLSFMIPCKVSSGELFFTAETIDAL